MSDFVTPDVGHRIPLASRPFNDASLDMGRPPQTSRAYSRTGRSALAAGTLSTVGDNAAREDVHGNVEVRDFDGYDADVMHAVAQNPAAGEHDFVPMAGPGSEGGRRCAVCLHIHESYDAGESLRQARLRRWQTIR